MSCKLPKCWHLNCLLETYFKVKLRHSQTPENKWMKYQTKKLFPGRLFENVTPTKHRHGFEWFLRNTVTESFSHTHVIDLNDWITGQTTIKEGNFQRQKDNCKTKLYVIQAICDWLVKVSRLGGRTSAVNHLLWWVIVVTVSVPVQGGVSKQYGCSDHS